MSALQWDPEAHVPASDTSRRRTMHGIPVEACGLMYVLDHDDPLATHGPHLHTSDTRWCAGWAATSYACPTAPESDDAGHDHSHGRHAWVRGVTWVLCEGYRWPVRPPTYAPPDNDDDPRGEHADRAAGHHCPGDHCADHAYNPRHRRTL